MSRAAHIAPDAVEDVLQRLAAEGEVHLEAKRDFSVALWVDPSSREWQSLSDAQMPSDGTSLSVGLAQGVLARMTDLQSTLVSLLYLMCSLVVRTAVPMSCLARTSPPGTWACCAHSCVFLEKA